MSPNRHFGLKVSLLLTFIFSASSSTADNAAIRTYRGMIQRGDYVAALQELNQPIRKRASLQPDELAELLVMKAEFYEKHIGDFIEAEALAREAESLASPKSSLEREAKDAANRIRKNLEEHQESARYVKQLEQRLEEEGLSTGIGEIKKFIEGHSESIFLGHLWCFLGEAYFRSGENRKAYRAYQEALRQRPAIYFKYSFVENRLEARQKWRLNLVHNLAISLITLMIVVVIPLFVAAKPWRWLTWRHAGALALVLALWAAVYFDAIHLVDAITDVEPFRRGAAVVSATPGMALSEPLDALFYYGIFGVVGVFVIAVATSRFKRKLQRTATNVLASLLLTTALAALFTIKYLPSDKLVGEFPFAFYRLSTNRPVSYLLSDPLRYPGLKIEKLEEEAPKSFVRKYYDGSYDN